MKKLVIIVVFFVVIVLLQGCTTINTPTLTPSVTIAVSTPTPQSTSISTMISQADGMPMVYVPYGSYLMGSDDGDPDEKPMRSVFVKSFWIDQTEVTQEMYALCDDPGCEKPTCTLDGTNMPVVCVNWKNANAYCQWAGRRLPTEVEWEKAARGTDGSLYPWGNDAATCDYAVMDDGGGNGCGLGSSPWQVGSIPAGISPYGAYDMAGNVWEWVDEWEEHDMANGAGHVLKGGGYYSIPYTVRPAKREVLHLPVDKLDALGFRCAVDVQ